MTYWCQRQGHRDGEVLTERFAGNEIVAQFRIIVGKRIGSAAPQIFLRILDGVDAGVTEMIAHAARHVADVLALPAGGPELTARGVCDSVGPEGVAQAAAG